MNDEREPIGWCSYDKSPIYENDDYLRYKGRLYHRFNFLQMNLDERGNWINDEEDY
jgi:hypothetical protein